MAYFALAHLRVPGRNRQPQEEVRHGGHLAQQERTMQEERLLTAAQVAERLQLSEAMVWRLLSRGEIRSLKIGFARRIPESAVADFIRAGVAAEAGRLAGGAG